MEGLRAAVEANVGVAYLATWEDERAWRLCEALAREAPGGPVPCYRWSVTQGLVLDGQPVEGAAALPAALRHAARPDRPGLYVFQDVHPWLEDPVVQRALRDCFRASRTSHRTVVLTGPRLVVPEDLVKEIMAFELGLPGTEELGQVVRVELARRGPGTPPPARLEALVNALRGLTLDEAGIALRVGFRGRPPESDEALAAVVDFKSQVTRKLGFLTYVETRVREADVGGLQGLKTWLTVRRRAFGAGARARNVRAPHGVLVMGVPGCGKSMSVQLVAGMWDLPLLRLDLATVYSGRFGTPEASLQRALGVAEALAPCVLWIDEIEKGIAGIGSGETGVVARVFGSFLTWMQEKTAAVFVAATANMIDLLPPEVLRKGRFDEVFFIDLPTHAERTAIWEIHLRKLGVVPRKFPPSELAKMTDQWTAAEIEQVVLNATLAALAEEREPEDRDLLVALGQTVPIARTMAEKIKQVRHWASDRATPATPRSHA